jgi:hypothetical protein
MRSARTYIGLLAIVVLALFATDPLALAWPGSGWFPSGGSSSNVAPPYQTGVSPPAVPLAASYSVTGSMSLYDTRTAYVTGLRAAMYTTGNGQAATALIASGSLSASSQWAVRLSARMTPPYNTSYPQIGVAVATGTTGSSTAASILLWSSSGAAGLHVTHFNPGGARTAGSFNEGSNTTIPQDSVNPFAGPVYLRILCDGTDFHYQTSLDSDYWTDWYSEAALTGMAYYGFAQGLDYTSGNGFSVALILDNEVTTSVPIFSITGATQASPIVLTLSAATTTIHDGDFISVHGVGGNTNANTSHGNFTQDAVVVHVVDSTHLQELGTTGNAAYTGGGTAILVSR